MALPDEFDDAIYEDELAGEPNAVGEYGCDCIEFKTTRIPGSADKGKGCILGN
jgi:hypothetical protein